jgi:hypothetical protein
MSSAKFLATSKAAKINTAAMTVTTTMMIVTIIMMMMLIVVIIFRALADKVRFV